MFGFRLVELYLQVELKFAILSDFVLFFMNDISQTNYRNAYLW